MLVSPLGLMRAQAARARYNPWHETQIRVEFDASRAELLAEITEHARPTPLYSRPDGSVTNW